MTEKHIGLGPHREKPAYNGEIVVVDRKNLPEIKKLLEEALVTARQKEPSIETDSQIDLIRNLISDVDETKDLVDLLSSIFDSGIIIPEEGEGKKKRPLGFQVPEPKIVTPD